MAFKMKGKPYKMGTHKTKATMAYMKSPLEQAKPDYPDIDGDGNTTESMKKAAADKKSPMEMKSPMKRAGIYKTLDDGTMVQVPRDEYEQDMETEGDGSGETYTLTGRDAVMGAENWGEDAKKTLREKQRVHMAEDVYNLKGDARSKYTDKTRRKAQEIDNRIQDKVNKGIELTPEEKEYQRRALINLAREDKENI